VTPKALRETPGAIGSTPHLTLPSSPQPPKLHSGLGHPRLIQMQRPGRPIEIGYRP
jgi:hypothetical protein